MELPAAIAWVSSLRHCASITCGFKPDGKIQFGGQLISIALFVCIAISAGSFAWSYWQAGFGGVSRWIAVFGIVWLASYWRKWKWFPTFALGLSLLLAAIGVWFEFHPGWIFSGAAFALIAWDFSEYREKLKFMPRREDIQGRTRRRILRISILLVMGLAFVSLIFFLTGRFTNDWGLFLLIIILIGCLQAISWVNG